MTGFAKSGLVALGLLVAACGGKATSGGSSGAGGSSGTGGSSGSAGSGGTSPSGCPASEPASGQACSTPDLRCTYGDTVRPECRDEWLCNAGKWTTTKSVCQHYTACPSAPPSVGSVCSKESMVCDYPDGTLCLCASCVGGPCSPPPPHWQCALPPTTPGCPAIVPNDGSACSAAEGTKCVYGNVCGPSGASVTCSGGAWKWEKQIPCPA